ncbi:Rieske 2Fe-2S domain-containing protein [Actinomadura violacea]|uniref:Rieske-type oxygenase n=1 Tax=Actinomadura violacea TaxID=2819934 RepID=A0ABS3RQZ0_9ACTN|nr:Rieske 2Fe-2S domain-containing protein [Actinomadura violacea]MBO2458723.1 3-ketosteroid-9-alpha-hydroxylase subunit A [Actinomadura violacea]
MIHVTATESDAVRKIEAEAISSRFARGWHCLGLAETFKDGKPHTVNAFGQKLVVFTGEDGKTNVLDGYCRHMGGDLSDGTVKGNEIACPFHDWRWGGDGRCKKIPYARRVPLRARTAAWPTMEKNQLLFVWNDPEGKQPPDDVTIPVIEGAARADWTDWRWTEQVVHTNCREIIDNVVDMAHFFYIHNSFPTFFKNIFEGQVATQIMKGKSRPDARREASGRGGPRMLGNTSVASYHGPSFMIDELTYHYEGYDLQSVLINCHYPIDEHSFSLHSGIIVQHSDKLPPEVAEATAEKLSTFILTGFEQDVAIWKRKARIDNPLLCEEDGPVYQLRRWYQQFYVDAADVQPEMTDRFEFEIDTTRPVESWEKEVEENLARRASEGASA